MRYDPEIQSRFTCPECGSDRFGSFEDENSALVGRCHGDHGACTFTWARTDEEDAKVFTYWKQVAR